MDVEWMPGADPSAVPVEINPFSFHFWTRGFPERIPFGSELTRVAHGGNFVAFYYQEEFRSAWMSLEQGDRVRDPHQAMRSPFPTLIIGIRGHSRGCVDGVDVEVRSGEAVFMPENALHEWWNESDEPAEAILVMFGEGA